MMFNAAHIGIAKRAFWRLLIVWGLQITMASGVFAAEVIGLNARPANATCVAPARPPQSTPVALNLINRPGFLPTALVQSPQTASIFYMLDRYGRIFRYQRNGVQVQRLNQFADTKDRSVTAFNGTPYGELGLLGMALHPGFAQNGKVYLYYSALGTTGTPVEARLSRFFSRDGGVTLDMASEEVLIRMPRTTQYHWGGTLGFGADGYLYAAFGDGGTPSANAQDLSNLFGKMIRIGVDAPSGYTIPADNPFRLVAGARPEIYAYGFRNPWKWSFDAATGDLWEGDVGANNWEEINLVHKGGNYGWPVREGAHCTGQLPCTSNGLIDPIFEYAHEAGEAGAAIIGGYIYRGTQLPALQGVYIFADTRGMVYALRYDSAGKPMAELIAEGTSQVSTFGQDAAGELVVAIGGNVLALSPPTDGGVISTFPERLSQTGCMSPSDPSKPIPALIPYDVNSPLWSDGATKDRWFTIPDGSTIRRLSDGDFELPIGSVTVKTFKVQGKLVETRLFVRHDDGEWAGYSYEWNDAQTDAFLLPAGKQKMVGGQRWTFPSRSQCLSCHTEVAGRTLGLETAQLNRDLLYPATNRVANQMATLSGIGMFEFPLNVPAATLDRLAEPSNVHLGLDVRARSYLHANCSMCHRPNGPGQGPEDFRYSLPTTSVGATPNIGAVNVVPTQSTFGIPDARLIAPGKPEKSIVHHRMQILDLGRMPPLGTAAIDTSGLALIGQWIQSGLGMGSADTDGDGFADNVDNCKNTSNPNQLNSDGDAYGNLCDADFNNDGYVNSLDLGMLRNAMGSARGQPAFNANVDMNGDGLVNALDLGLFRARFGKPVGDQ
ncbi:PQQ-dependent sugar dehydrogenase [Comamonadaceae bacterium G21597-S1]|nr:PQQ-dependent sugar dehydrogenase [Comamonadaceae bacterium G21597-S1]